LQKREEKAVAKPMTNNQGIVIQPLFNVSFDIGSWKLIGIIVDAIRMAPTHKRPKNTG
jgi:hypothetical protein